jgi:adenine-specific DNA-methyltransferase
MGALSLILNSQVVDRIFRCLSGSVAVSASELHAIPLPPINKIEDLEKLLSKGNRVVNLKESAEQIIAKAYGLEE